MTAAASLARVRLSADARAAAAALRRAAELAVVIAPDGSISESRLAPELRDAIRAAPGQAAIEIVPAEHREALAAALAAAAAGRIPDPLEVRHAELPSGAAIRYAALPADRVGDVLLVGRLLQRTDALAMQVSEARLAADRDELSRRATEARYQMLFQGAADAVLLVALPDGAVDEANPRALSLLGLAETEVVGRPAAALVAEADRDRLGGLIAAVAEGGEVSAMRLALASSGRRVSVQGRAFRAFDRAQLMLRLDALDWPEAALSHDGGDELTPAETLVARLMRGGGQAVALAEAGGRIIWASEAFPAPAEGCVVGRSCGELFEAAGIALRSVLGMAREHGRATCPGLRFRTEAGEVSGDLTIVALAGDAPAGFGLFFQPDGPGAPESRAGGIAAEAQEIAAAIGQAPLRDLVRDVADSIERSCIEAALRLTEGNKAAAAEALGLSRQSLYLKLHRFGLL